MGYNKNIELDVIAAECRQNIQKLFGPVTFFILTQMKCKSWQSEIDFPCTAEKIATQY